MLLHRLRLRLYLHHSVQHRSFKNKTKNTTSAIYSAYNLPSSSKKRETSPFNVRQGPQNAAVSVANAQLAQTPLSTSSSSTNSTSSPSPISLTSPNSSLASGGLLGAMHHHHHHHSSPPPSTQSPHHGMGGVDQKPQLPLRMPPPTSGGINEPQECPYCRRTFSCYYSLKRHFQDKHEQSDTLYVCEFCHRRYRTKNSLTTHKSLQHRGSSGMLKRLLKTSAIKNVLVPHHHHHHHSMTGHPRATSLFDFTSELGQPPPGIQ
ncbi:uncharacterized protein LOC129944674 [Eupeodes corollae]|uniref:uncharacterized protein LOC129944674 n=1 Tax=Eupeodes corollae TaxID=290404 RepID=UPI00249097D7|nr:uncharacterized protein LOC129944674 [Eupeodes corollae]